MRQDELRAYAARVGAAFLICKPMDEHWAWHEEIFEVARVVARPLVTGRFETTLMQRSEWPGFLDGWYARWRGDAYMASFAEAVSAQPVATVPSIVLAIHQDASIEIGDGWHRLSMAIRDGVSLLPAVIGTEISRI